MTGPIIVAGKEFPEPVAGEGCRWSAWRCNDSVQESGIVSNVGEDLSEVPVVLLGVVSDVPADRERVRSKRPPELELIVDRRDGLGSRPGQSGW